MNIFNTCGPGTTPSYPCEILPPAVAGSGRNFNRNFRHWNEMRTWCEEQGWKLNRDFCANAVIGKPWYFNSEDKQLLFTLRWT